MRERAERHVRLAARDEGHLPAAACYEPTTCVRDRARVSSPVGNRHHNTERGSDRRDGPLHSSPVDHKKEPKNFCCVTTRGPAPRHPLPVAKLARRRDGLLHDGAPAVAAPRPHVPAVPRGGSAAVVAVWPPASAGRVAGTADPGSSVGSNGGADRSGRTPGGDKHVASVDCD